MANSKGRFKLKILRLIENDQIKQSEAILMDENNVKQPFFCRSKEQWKRSKGKTWSHGTNLCLPFAINVTLNHSNVYDAIILIAVRVLPIQLVINNNL